MLRCALRSEELALVRFQHSFQYCSTLSGLRVGHANARHREAAFGIPIRELVLNAQRGLRDESQTTPLEVAAEFEHFLNYAQRRTIAFPGDHAFVLVLDTRL